jgi:hypothetical protein
MPTSICSRLLNVCAGAVRPNWGRPRLSYLFSVVILNLFALIYTDSKDKAIYLSRQI